LCWKPIAAFVQKLKIQASDGIRQPTKFVSPATFPSGSAGVIPLVLLAAIETGLRLADYGYDPVLFKKITIGNGEYFVNNETFGLRFFPPQPTDK
jgi:hypothetical protein